MFIHFDSKDNSNIHVIENYDRNNVLLYFFCFFLMGFIFNRIYEVMYLTSCLRQMLQWLIHTKKLYLILGHFKSMHTRILLGVDSEVTAYALHCRHILVNFFCCHWLSSLQYKCTAHDALLFLKIILEIGHNSPDKEFTLEPCLRLTFSQTEIYSRRDVNYYYMY